MGTQTVTATTTGIWPAPSGMVLNLLKFAGAQGAGILCTVVGTAQYSVEVSGDDPFVALPTHWNPMDGPAGSPMSALSASINSNLEWPATCIRLNVASLTTGSTVTLSVVSTDL